MPIYNTPQPGPYAESGKNLRVVGPGGFYKLFDGTEEPVQNLPSVAIVRGPSAGQAQVYSNFHAVGMPADMIIDVQSSNIDEDTAYVTIGQMTSELDSPAGFPEYADGGTPTFYRVKISLYGSGEMPVVTIQR